MADNRKKSEPNVFDREYWKRPPKRSLGDSDPDPIFNAVGRAMSQWEHTEETLSSLFVQLTECTTAATFSAVRRAYGAVESGTGRRKVLREVAEVYFGTYWQFRVINKTFGALIDAVSDASRLRDDVAHGVVWGNTRVDDKDFGAYLVPPEYNSGRTSAFIEDSDDPLRFNRADYRYISEDINLISHKFGILRRAIGDYSVSITKTAGNLSADLMLKIAEEQQKTRGK
jgi:hypothetical protein